MTISLLVAYAYDIVGQAAFVSRARLDPENLLLESEATKLGMCTQHVARGGMKAPLHYQPVEPLCFVLVSIRTAIFEWIDSTIEENN
jgi:hypothetical protein